MNVLVDLERKRVDTDVSIVSRDRANRPGRTCHQRHQSESLFVFILGLMVNTALVAMVSKDGGSQLAAGITIDTSGIDKEIARHILR